MVHTSSHSILLSSRRSSPYKPSLPDNETSHSSLKRKLGEDSDSGHEATTMTAPGDACNRIKEADTERGCESPSTKIAQRLGALDLERNERSLSPRKRLKLQSEPSVSHLEEKQQGRFIPAHNIFVNPSPPQSPTFSLHAVSTGRDAESTPSINPKRLRSPPPQQRHPRPEGGSDEIDLMPLTWQESEITGHVIASPDDDGEGINGIGFRPTPQIAYARKQRRKQQVSEWRAREMRDARQKRFQRRQGCRLAVDTGSRKKLVRFADLT